MPNGSVHEVVSQMARPTSAKEQTISLDKAYALQLRAEKKFAGDKEKIQKATSKAIANYNKKLQEKSLQQRKAELKEEYNLSLTYMDKLKTRSKAFGLNIAEAAQKAVKSSVNAVGSGVENYLGVYSQYMSGIATRLQGTGKEFRDITGAIRKGVGSSQYVSQVKVLENLSKLVEQGISFNVEQRAFLATVSDKIATTFDAFDSNLARIVRIQQADSTAARLGLESQLTKFLNSTFGDTSYLSQMFDTVSANVLSASATMGRDKSIAFEYTVQKWLGSLGAVGVSESTIQQLAQGLGYLGSGDITSLAGNAALQNLLVMASARGGADYAGMLQGGLTASSANALLKNVVQLSQEIASTNNRVLLSQYAQIFGMTVPDLIAITNLTAKDLKEISSNMLTYEQLYSETESQIKTLGSRMSVKERIDTMFENVMANVGEGIASSAGMYTTWLITDLVEKATGGIPIPTFGVMGSFIDLETTVTGLIKAGIVGISTIANIGSILSGLSGANNLSLSKWGEGDIMRKGTGFTGLKTTGVTSTTSETMFIGSASESDIYAGSVGAAKEEAKETIAGEQGTSRDLTEIIEDDVVTGINKIITILDSTGIVIRGTHSSMLGVPSSFGGI